MSTKKLLLCGGKQRRIFKATSAVGFETLLKQIWEWTLKFPFYKKLWTVKTRAVDWSTPACDFTEQVNDSQKLLFLHQLTHYMTTDCSLNYMFSTWKLQPQNMLCTQIVFVLPFRTIYVRNMFWACNIHVLNS